MDWMRSVILNKNELELHKLQSTAPQHFHCSHTIYSAYISIYCDATAHHKLPTDDAVKLSRQNELQTYTTGIKFNDIENLLDRKRQHKRTSLIVPTSQTSIILVLMSEERFCKFDVLCLFCVLGLHWKVDKTSGRRESILERGIQRELWYCWGRDIGWKSITFISNNSFLLVEEELSNWHNDDTELNQLNGWWSWGRLKLNELLQSRTNASLKEGIQFILCLLYFNKNGMNEGLMMDDILNKLDTKTTLILKCTK